MDRLCCKVDRLNVGYVGTDGPLLFVGTYEHLIDPKNRLKIPADVRDEVQRSLQLADEEPLPFYVTFNENRTGLSLYAKPVWEAYLQQMRGPGAQVNQAIEAEKKMLPYTRRVDTDKQNRILLPEILLRRLTLGTEVVLLGLSDHLEIRNRADWEREQDELFDSFDGGFINPRRLLGDVPQTP